MADRPSSFLVTRIYETPDGGSCFEDVHIPLDNTGMEPLEPLPRHLPFIIPTSTCLPTPIYPARPSIIMWPLWRLYRYVQVRCLPQKTFNTCFVCVGWIGTLSAAEPVKEIIFRETQGSYDLDFHNAPSRRYIIITSGTQHLHNDARILEIGTEVFRELLDVDGNSASN